MKPRELIDAMTEQVIDVATGLGGRIYVVWITVVWVDAARDCDVEEVVHV